MTDQSKHDQMLALVKRLRGVEITAVRTNRDLLGTWPVTQAQNDARSAADALTAALDEIERLRSALYMIATHRAECHAHDDDMGHSRRSFDDEDMKLMEYAAARCIGL